MDEMDLEDSAREKEKQKRAEGGGSPDLKRARLAEIYSAQIPEDTEMESQGKKYDDDDDEYVEDDEYVDDDDDDEEEEEAEQQQMDFTEPEKPPEMPQEDKDFIRKVNESLIETFGTADSLEIDIILREKAWKEEEDRNQLKQEETEEEKEEKIKTEEILNHVDSLTVFSCDGSSQSGSVGNLNFFLLSPWTDMDCTKHDMIVRSLDMYYKRLMPNNESACGRFSPSLWNRLPEVDMQYVLLYNELDTLFQQKRPEDFKPNDPSEIRHNLARFCPRIQRGNFFKWMDEDKFLEKTEDECKRLIIERQKKILEEYCSSRIRYVKFKRALAKELKIISE